MQIKNVRSGIVIIADDGIKLAPGETVELENPTRQVAKAIADGLVAEILPEPEAKSKSRTASKSESKKAADSTVKTDVATPIEDVGNEQPALLGEVDGTN